jgi:hypothetical protein
VFYVLEVLFELVETDKSHTVSCSLSSSVDA